MSNALDPSVLTARHVAEAAAAIARQCPIAPKLGVVLGSGLGAMAKTVSSPTCIRYQDIPHMPAPHIAGHAGELVIGHLGDAPVAMLSGRVHAYEGHSQDNVTFGVRLLAALGCQRLLVTNAAGGLNPHFVPGDLMVICDQMNFTGHSPLLGPNDASVGPRFVDMTMAYGPSGRAAWAQAANDTGVSLRHGTYVGVLGPAYETPSEVRAFRLLGGDAVGMSTISEVLVARHRGLEVAGLSVITNLGAGLSGQVLSHEEVTDVAGQARGRVSELLVAMCRRWQP